MKAKVFTTLLILITSLHSFSQKNMISFSDDNDEWLKTDKYYTNGTFINYNWKSSPTTETSLSINQIMMTPNKISRTYYNPNDYRYGCALYLGVNTLLFNSTKKINLNVGVSIGVRGPNALGKQTQTVMHKIFDGDKPNGWGTQLESLPIFNLNMSFDKGFINTKVFDASTITSLYFGTLKQSAHESLLFRLGLLTPNYSGSIKKYSSNKVKLFIFAKPSIEYVLQNYMLSGLESKKMLQPDIEPIVWSYEYGVTLVVKRLSLSFSKIYTSKMIKNMGYYAMFGFEPIDPSHKYCNVTINYTF